MKDKACTHTLIERHKSHDWILETRSHIGGKIPEPDLHFKYEHPIEEYNFRILVLKPASRSSPIAITLHNKNIGVFKGYMALLYTWGDREKRYSTICNGRRLLLAKNLYSALKHLRWEEREITLWIEVICTNQDDQSEEAAHIGKMRKIYRNARTVLVWLGEAMSTCKRRHRKVTETCQVILRLSQKSSAIFHISTFLLKTLSRY